MMPNRNIFFLLGVLNTISRPIKDSLIWSNRVKLYGSTFERYIWRVALVLISWIKEMPRVELPLYLDLHATDIFPLYFPNTPLYRPSNLLHQTVSRQLVFWDARHLEIVCLSVRPYGCLSVITVSSISARALIAPRRTCCWHDWTNNCIVEGVFVEWIMIKYIQWIWAVLDIH